MSNSVRRWIQAAASLLALCLGGCGTVGFYSQAISGQAEILSKARPIGRVLKDRSVESSVAGKLRVVEDARQFAREELGLPAERQFGRFTALGRRYVSWVVYAAPEFSVEGKEWWYPVVGRLEYRGYFSEKAANEEAARCQAEGYEVHVGGVEAYSTLGWFRDPILDTCFRRTDEELAELIFHELTHVKIFIPGDTDFNEALATATAEAGVVRWLQSKGDRAGLAQYRASLAKDREIIHLLLATREKLRRVYAQESIGVPEMRREKAAAFRRMRAQYAAIRQRWRGDSRYDRTFAKPWNNARLNTVATYYDLVPGFERLLQRHGGNLDAFFAAVDGMRGWSKEERRAALMHSDGPNHPPR